jgi:hypothetical protein
MVKNIGMNMVILFGQKDQILGHIKNEEIKKELNQMLKESR